MESMGYQQAAIRHPTAPLESPNAANVLTENNLYRQEQQLCQLHRSPRQDQQQLTKQVRLLLFLLVGLVLFLAIVENFVVMPYYISRQIDERFRLRPQQQLVDCRQSQSGPSVFVDELVNPSIRKRVDAVVDEQLQKRLARHGELRIDANRTLTSHDRCAASVSLHAVNNGSHQSRGYQPVLGWTASGDSAFIRRCFEYDPNNGQFRVFQDSLYLVASHLAFKGPRSAIYGQRVMRLGFKEPIMAENEVSTTSGERTGNIVHNSVLVGIARLRADERIYVDAKPVRQLARGNSLSTLTLLKL